MNNNKVNLSVKDLEYLYQYIVLKYNEVKYYKNLFLLITKRKTEIYEFISVIDSKYLKKSAIMYVTEDVAHNNSIFSDESNDILTIDINKEFLNFLRIKIDNLKLIQRIDDNYN
jgi:hypothetical protein